MSAPPESAEGRASARHQILNVLRKCDGRAEARPSEAMKVYFVAGEASGDNHGAALDASRSAVCSLIFSCQAGAARR